MKNLFDDFWFKLIVKSYDSPPVIWNDNLLPAFPSDTIQLNTTGQSGIETLKEAYIFYLDCCNIFEELGVPIKNTDRLLDFGVGWGRIARFFIRNIGLKNIHGLDVSSELISSCKENFRTENFHQCSPNPPSKLSDNYYDFIIGYSVFSHLSEEACLKWIAEFSRILKPGGICALTTRGRPFFDYCESLKVKSKNKDNLSDYNNALGRLFENFNLARQKYDEGEFVHSNIDGVNGGGDMNKSFYGETFIPELYASNVYAPYLKLERFMYQPSYQSHPIMFFRKGA